MRKIITLSALIFTYALTYAQQDPGFSQNFLNKLDYNAGYAGMNKEFCGTVIGRDQWLDFPGLPQTFLFSGDAYLPSIGGGLGLTVMDDHLGFERTFEVKLSYSYHIVIGPGILGIGPEVGFYQKSLITNGWLAPDGSSSAGLGGSTITDPYIPTNGISNGTYDLGFGAYYETPQGLYVGISSSHLPAQTIKAADMTYEYDVARQYYLMAGYTYNASANWDILPDLFVESDASTTQFQVDARAEYNKMIWFGVGYRMQDAVIGLLGFNYEVSQKANLKIGYSYDLTTSEIHSYSSGSHEIVLQFCFKIVHPPKVTTHQNTRFL